MYSGVVEYAVNVGKSNVKRCSRNVNVDRVDARLNGKPLEEADCLKYLGSQVAVDRGYERKVEHRMNEGHKAWVC